MSSQLYEFASSVTLIAITKMKRTLLKTTLANWMNRQSFYTCGLFSTEIFFFFNGAFGILLDKLFLHKKKKILFVLVETITRQLLVASKDVFA